MEVILREKIREAVKVLYNNDVTDELIQVQETKKDFKGDFTLVVFPLLRYSKNTPEKTGEDIGEYLVKNFSAVSGFNVIKGFLNLIISYRWWVDYFLKSSSVNILLNRCIANTPDTILVEYSSPNTNKPLHLGHIRNNLLGFSIYRILSACGHNVIKTNIVNDRGIHICKSMLAWLKWGEGETPSTSGMKGDHLIGKYYVMFDKRYKDEISELKEQGLSEEEALRQAPLILEAQQLLKKWEEHDQETLDLWKRMNQWAYEGFDETYSRMGVGFDKTYYESDTYLLGKRLVEEGLEKNVLIKKEDGSVWADLSADGLDQKLLIRADGTSVYITQDLGTAQQRYDEFSPERLIYVVGNEQIYHFNVLKLILKKLGRAWADAIYHMSYGMVELPQGKMKSREGTVVDADDLMDEMMETAERMTRELGKIEDFDDQEASALYRMVGLGALKYYILKVDPMKTMTFNPEESIDFNGNTGPFIQYTYARIQSVIRKSGIRDFMDGETVLAEPIVFVPKERGLIRLLHDFPAAVNEAALNYSPALVANYAYELTKEYNQFYHDHSILKAESETVIRFRLGLSALTGQVIKTAMELLGIEVPERM
jgi:arginyl-tRNA synthetase